MATRLTVDGYIRKVRRFFDKQPKSKCGVFRYAAGDLQFVRADHIPELVAIYTADVPDAWLEVDATDMGLREN